MVEDACEAAPASAPQVYTELRQNSEEEAHGDGTCIAVAEEQDPFPYLSQYYGRGALLRNGGRHLRAGRYFAAHGGAGECSDDGHVTRWAARKLCAFCLELSHQMRDCPWARCSSCFQTGHGGRECPNYAEKGSLDENLAEQQQAALAALGGSVAATGEEAAAAEGASTQKEGAAAVRCVACAASSAGHANCAALPAVQNLHADATAAAAAAERFFIAEAASTPFARWAQRADAVPASGMTAGAGMAAARANAGAVCDGTTLEGAVLRLLGEASGAEGQWRERLLAAPVAAVEAAAHRLGRMRALLPGVKHGCAPQLTALGWWLSQLAVPPQAACMLLHGALWGVLLPVAVLVVLLESAPPDLALSDGSTPPRKSGHFALVAAYFRWREGRETGISRRFGSDFFWEAVDQRVTLACKHTQHVLGYDGDDAAFEEMDGELMDVRRNDGRPWTLASAVGGSEASARWARFCAALASACPPQPSGRRGEWVVRTEAGDGTPSLETVVSSPHAVIFVPEEPVTLRSSPLEVGVDGIRGTLYGGEGALEEAVALRQRLSERMERALDIAAASETISSAAATMDEADITQVLHFLRSSAGQLLPAGGDCGLASKRAKDDVEMGLLELLGLRAPITACTTGIGATAPSQQGRQDEGAEAKMAAGVEETLKDVEALRPWAVALAAAALLRVLKRRAVAAEDYELASRLKVCEAAAAVATAEGRDRATTLCGEDRAAALERIAKRKRKAVDDEDYSLAASLKRQEVEIAAQPMLPAAGEMETLAAEKAEAVAAEDFERAAALRQRLLELEAACRGVESAATSRAARLAAEAATRAEVLLAVAGFGAQGLACVATDEAMWTEVRVDVGAAAGSACR